jgi:hypothetical protein
MSCEAAVIINGATDATIFDGWRGPKARVPQRGVISGRLRVTCGVTCAPEN